MISVCLATYNGERFIQRQLETIIEQLGEDDEIIISDDGSTDDTLRIIEGLHSPLIHVYINNGEHGYTPNFENALRYAHGEYIFLSDQDDVWLPRKLEICMNALKTCDFVVSDALIIDADGNKIFPSFFDKRRHFQGFWGNMLTMGYIGCCMAFRRKLLERVLPFPSDHRLCTHDNWILLIALGYYKVKILDEKLVGYRRHGRNASVGQNTASASTYFRLKYRAYLLVHLIGRMFVGYGNKR